jgi:hypothetical protein
MTATNIETSALGEDEGHRARVLARLARWEAFRDDYIAKGDAERGNRPYSAEELYPCPKIGPKHPLKPLSNNAEPSENHSQGKNASPQPTGVAPITKEVHSTDSATVATDIKTHAQALLNQLKLKVNTSSKKRPREESLIRSTSSLALSASPITTNLVNASALASLDPIPKKQKSTDAPSPGSLGLSKKVSPSIGDPLMAELGTETGQLPDWYVYAKMPAQVSAQERQTWDKLKDLSRDMNIVQGWQGSERTPSLLNAIVEAIYRMIDELRSTDVTPFGLKRAKLLDSEHGLPIIFNTQKGKMYPSYVINDAKGLHKKWLTGILDGSNMFRGIKNMIKEKNMKGECPSIDKTFKIDWHFFGERHLVNGDWFANQLCAVRDGAHGSAQGSISGIEGKGATSIAMSGDIYADTDVSRLKIPVNLQCRSLIVRRKIT